MNLRPPPPRASGSPEALLIEALEPPQNRQRRQGFNAVEFIQVADPELLKKQRAALLNDLKKKLQSRRSLVLAFEREKSLLDSRAFQRLFLVTRRERASSTASKQRMMSSMWQAMSCGTPWQWAN